MLVSKLPAGNPSTTSNSPLVYLDSYLPLKSPLYSFFNVLSDECRLRSWRPLLSIEDACFNKDR